MTETVDNSATGTSREPFSADDKMRIVLTGLSRQANIGDICRREGISEDIYDGWKSEFLQAGRRQFAGADAAMPGEAALTAAAAETTEAYAMLRDAIEALGEGFVLYDRNDCFVMANRRYQDIMAPYRHLMMPGTPFAKITGQAMLDRYVRFASPPEGGFAAVLTALKPGEPLRIEFLMADGSRKMATVSRLGDGGLVATIIDISERRKAELRDEENRLAAVNDAIQALDEGLVLYDADLNFVIGNRMFADIFHSGEVPFPNAGDSGVATIKHLIDIGFYVIPRGISNERFLAEIIDNLRAYAKKVPMITSSGRMFSTSVHQPALGGYLISFTDITEQRKAEAELVRQRDIAHQNEKLSALGGLLAGVAHELNNPLSIVVGYAQMLQNKIADPQQNERIERIGQAAERCAKIVKMFLSMARQRPARVENCSLNEIVEMALDVVGNGLKSSGATMSLMLDPALPPVAADPDQLGQVFTNLIANAEHALAGRGDNGLLQIVSHYDSIRSEVVVEVSDNGAGIPHDIQARIFEPFFTTKDVGRGTGVGLAFCHRIVSSHDGSLTLRSEPGKGATFVVRMAAVERSSAPALVGPDDGRPMSTQRILVVDDEVGVTELIQDILEDSGYRVEVCNDPRKALELLKTEVFDAILSDMKMPGMDGETFLQELTSLGTHYSNRLAFVTGDTMSSRVADYLESTASPHLEKPIVPDELIALVEQLCGE